MFAIPVAPTVATAEAPRRVDNRDVVDLVDVNGVARVARRIALPRGQRIPAHRGTDAHRKRRRESVAAVEADQGRCVGGTRDVGARGPAPAIVDLHPATVVERREAPRRIVDPRVAPRRDIGPAAVAIRRPVLLHVSRRIPDRTDVFLVGPTAVRIEVLVARHVLRDITLGLAVAKARLAGDHPVVERHRRRRGRHQLRRHVGVGSIADDAQSVPRRDQRRAAVAIGTGLSGEDRDAAVRRQRVDAIAARLQQREHGTRHGDAVGIVRIEAPHAQRHASAHDVGVEGVVVELLDVDLGASVHRQRSRADADLRAAGVADEQRIARRDRLVEIRDLPFGIGLGVRLHVALHESDASDPTRDVGVRGTRRQQRHERQDDRARQQCEAVERACGIAVRRRRQVGVHRILNSGRMAMERAATLKVDERYSLKQSCSRPSAL